MSSFHEIQFPPKIAYGASGGPGFSTSIALSVNGFEQRNINWQSARGKWDISTGIKSESDIAEVLAFFRARFGKAYGFRFRDWSDYKAVNQRIGTGNSKTKSFQLYKSYRSGDYSYVRRISKPVEGRAKVYVDSKQIDQCAIDNKTGVITFEKPPVKDTIITCDFEFDTPARFDMDQIMVRCSGPNNFVVDTITIVEIK